MSRTFYCKEVKIFWRSKETDMGDIFVYTNILQRKLSLLQEFKFFSIEKMRKGGLVDCLNFKASAIASFKAKKTLQACCPQGILLISKTEILHQWFHSQRKLPVHPDLKQGHCFEALDFFHFLQHLFLLFQSFQIHSQRCSS